MHTSPLRVHEYDQADIVFVAAVLDPQMADDGQCASFFEDFAPKHLPFLQSKPHVLVLSHGLVYQVSVQDTKKFLLSGMAIALFLSGVTAALEQYERHLPTWKRLPDKAKSMPCNKHAVN